MARLELLLAVALAVASLFLVYFIITRYRQESSGPVGELYAATVRQARSPGFFEALGVPDTLDGRFDVLSVHIHAVLRRLKEIGAGASSTADRRRISRFAQRIHDHMMADMENNLRQLGTGDLAVGKRVKEMASALYGSMEAYDEGLDGDEASLHGALARNLYRLGDPSSAQSAAMASYVRALHDALARQDGSNLLEGRVVFPEVPSTVHRDH
ncbi:MAG: ubiquinol-cytochrome C chaperone family protein [Alphaproteobacteria bacterium]|nr:ubiquinol-cytochrome C chaperone family protein [Alphaproteobacteria bacterium]